MFQGPFPAEEMGEEGGDEADDVGLPPYWQRQQYMLFEPSDNNNNNNNNIFISYIKYTSITPPATRQDPTRQLLKFDLSLVHRFRLRYSTTCDSYYRDWFDAIDPSSKGVIPGWDKAIYSVDNVRRHLNEDIGQVTHPLV